MNPHATIAPGGASSISPYEHILSSRQFTEEFLMDVFERGDYMNKHEYCVSGALKNKIVALIFYETSTRTRLSFESAALRLGAAKIHTENAAEFSSVSKGETLEDTVRIVSSYADFLILRHGDDDSSEIAINHSDIPVINAGSGKLHHPTQALLDVYTIYKEMGRIRDLRITVIGDLLHGRTCDSLVYLLSKFSGNSFQFVAPVECSAKKKLIAYLKTHAVSFRETEDLSQALSNSDVVYMTRVQRERFANETDYLNVQGRYLLDKKNVETIPTNSIIMHPLPRTGEINPEIDDNPRSKYFCQASNGLYIRMALLDILNKHRK